MSSQTKHLMRASEKTILKAGPPRFTRFKIKFIYAASSAVAGEHLGDKCLLARGGASKNVSNRGSGLILFNLCSQQMGRAGSHLYVAILVSDVLDGRYVLPSSLG